MKSLSIFYPIHIDEIYDIIKHFKNYTLKTIEFNTDNMSNLTFESYSSSNIGSFKNSMGFYKLIENNTLLYDKNDRRLILNTIVDLDPYTVSRIVNNFCDSQENTQHIIRYIEDNTIDDVKFNLYTPINFSSTSINIDELFKFYNRINNDHSLIPDYFKNIIGLSVISQRLYRYPKKSDIWINSNYIKKLKNITLNDYLNLFNEVSDSININYEIKKNQYRELILDGHITFLGNNLINTNSSKLYKSLSDLKLFNFLETQISK
ncbi:MAG: hypothetical protein ACOC33_01925 [bacterium]